MDARPRPSANRRCIVILRGRGEAGGNTADALKNPSKTKKASREDPRPASEEGDEKLLYLYNRRSNRVNID